MNNASLVNILIGDGPAAAEIMGMKKPGNALRPCRTCNIKAQRRPPTEQSRQERQDEALHESEDELQPEALGEPQRSARNQRRQPQTLYVPHTDYDITNLPIRTDLRGTIEEVEQARSSEFKTLFGINHSSILLELHSVHFPRSFPVDIMHCVLQNITPQLFQLWSGSKLKIDDPRLRGDYVDHSSMPSYRMDSKAIESISASLAGCRADLPAYLGNAPRPIGNHYSSYKAAEWKAWLLLLGTPLLDQRLDEIYVANFRDLSQFYFLSTQHKLMEADVLHIEQLSTQFVKDYETLYYRNEPDRLPVCTVNVHSLLHFGLYIRDLGPACYWWQFVMERYCGIVKPMARSKSKMNISLSNAVVINEHLNHLRFAVWRDFGDETVPAEESLPRLLDSFKLHLTAHQRDMIQYCLGRPIEQIQGFKRCEIRRGLIVGSVQSQRKSETNRASHRVCYRRNGSDWDFGEVQFFVDLFQFGHWAWIRALEDIDIDKQRRVISYKRVGTLRWIRVEWIESVIGIIREGGVALIVTDFDLFD